MKIRFTLWIWYCRIVSCLAIPFVVIDFWEPDWWSRACSNIFFSALIIFVGVPGALVAVLLRTGKAKFIYSTKDEQRIEYKLKTFFGRFK